MFNPSKPAILMLLAGSLLVSAGVSARGLHASRVDINFAQTFVFASCPASAPAADACLDVTGVADAHGIGHAEFSRVAMVDPSTYDYTHPSCLPIETSGTLTLPRGTLDIHAPGHVCFADGVASYDIIITGGTGVYEGVLGSGKIVVPPPESDSTGRELWHLDLVQNDRGHHRER